MSAAVKGSAEVGGDVAGVARRAVDGVIEATKEIGGNLEKVAATVVIEAVNAAGTVGKSATRAVTDVLLGAVGGAKEVLNAVLPKPSETAITGSGSEKSLPKSAEEGMTAKTKKTSPLPKK